MNKEALEKRLQLVEAELSQAMANYNALNGIKNELNHWLREFEKEALVMEEKKAEVVLDTVEEKPVDLPSEP